MVRPVGAYFDRSCYDERMQFTYATPALLFPAVSLLFIAFTNRFISYANLVRNLHDRWRTEKTSALERQILNLKRRIVLIRNMQLAGALSLGLCVVCMVLLFFSLTIAAEIVFGGSLLLMLASLVLLLLEVQVSMGALDLQLADMAGDRSEDLHG